MNVDDNKQKTPILLVTNTVFSAVNFRQVLITELVNDHDVYVIAMGDLIDFHTLAEVNVNLIPVRVRLPFGRSEWRILTLCLFVCYCIWYTLLIRPRYVLSFTIVPNLVFNFLKLLLRFKLISNVTGFGKACSRRKSSTIMRFIFGIYVYLLHNSDHIFAQNSRDKAFLIKKGIHLKSVTALVGSGVDLLLFSPSLRRQATRVLFCSRLIQEKGIGEFLDIVDCFSKLKENKIKFSVAGAGDKKLQEQVQSNYRVQYHGHVTDIVEFFRKYDILLFCSVYDEGTPKTVLEALSSGMMVVCRRNAYTSDLEKLGFKIFVYTTREQAIEHICYISDLTEIELEMIFNENQLLVKQHVDVNRVCDSYRAQINI